MKLDIAKIKTAIKVIKTVKKIVDKRQAEKSQQDFNNYSADGSDYNTYGAENTSGDQTLSLSQERGDNSEISDQKGSDPDLSSLDNSTFTSSDTSSQQDSQTDSSYSQEEDTQLSAADNDTSTSFEDSSSYDYDTEEFGEDDSLRSKAMNAAATVGGVAEEVKSYITDMKATKKFASVVLQQTKFYTEIKAKKAIVIAEKKIYLEQLEALVLQQQEKTALNSQKFTVTWSKVSASRVRDI